MKTGLCREIYERTGYKTVESMVRCGIDLEGLCAVFTTFPKEEVIEIYYRLHAESGREEVAQGIKMNCS